MEHFGERDPGASLVRISLITFGRALSGARMERKEADN